MRWNYGHTTIPRHLRDVYVNEYGIADLLSQTDEDCVIAMTAITDARFQGELLDKSRRQSKKLRVDFTGEPEWSRNTPQRLRDDARAVPHRRHPARLPAGQRFHRGGAATGEGIGVVEGEYCDYDFEDWNRVACIGCKQR